MSANSQKRTLGTRVAAARYSPASYLAGVLVLAAIPAPNGKAGKRVVLGLEFQGATLAVERITPMVDNPPRKVMAVLNGLFLCGEGV